MHIPMSRREKCILPAGACDNTHHFGPETHVRNVVRNKEHLESKVFAMSASFALRSHDADNDHENGPGDEDNNGSERRQRRPPCHRQQDDERGKFGGKSPRHLARENIAGYPSWTLIKRGLRGVCARCYGLSRWVTQGSTAPGGVL